MKKITTIYLAVFSFAMVMSFTSCQKENSGTALKTNDDKLAINFTPAKTSSELLALRTQKSANLIRTLQDFDSAVSSRNTPLSKLSATHLAEFRKSLVVRDGVGVVSFYYDDLKAALSYDDFATVLAKFGLDVKQGYWGLSNDPVIKAKLNATSHKTASVSNEEAELESAYVADHPGYLCSTTLSHTCKKAEGSICLSGC